MTYFHIVGGSHCPHGVTLLTGALSMFLVLRQLYLKYTSLFCLVFNNQRQYNVISILF